MATETATKEEQPTSVLECDSYAVVDLIARIGDVVKNLPASGIDEDARVRISSLARKLLLASESPRETLMRQQYEAPASLVALTCGVECGAWKYLDQHEGPFVAAELGKSLGVDPPLMSRLMRHLGAAGYLDELGPDTYDRSNFTKAMASPLIGDVYPAYSKYCLPAWANFPAYAAKAGWQTPSSPMQGNYQDAMRTGMHYLDFVQSQADGHVFATHMRLYGMGRPHWTDPGFYPIQENLVAGFDDAEGAIMLVDIGGSVGHDLEQLLRKYPSLPGRFVLQDLPFVLANTKDLNSRIEVQAHNFNDAQPIQGSRAYYMHSILHDWPDDDCVAILSNITAAMTKGYSRLLINELVLPATGAHWEVTGVDMVMGVFLGAYERTRDQWERLLAAAGLTISEVWSTEAVNSQSVIECILV
ncbi:hypothetical protein PWT90_02936 [Aphanocladium album]|nr:hypothetical protein PWT90_02936 [Aphanocladium album]